MPSGGLDRPLELALFLRDRMETKEDWGHLKMIEGWKQKELLPAELYLLWEVRSRLASPERKSWK